MQETFDASRQAGHALLETSIAIGALLWLSLGIIDIAGLYEGRSAIRAAVSTALRCAHPSDAACRGSGTADLGILYDVYESERETVYYREAYEYGGVARASFAPVYSYPDLSAEVLSRVTFDRRGSRTLAIEKLYPASAEVRYLARSSGLPAIRGALSTEPRFVSPESGTRASASLAIPIGSLSGSTLRERVLGRVSFRLAPAPGGSLPCYVPAGDGTVDFTRRCEESWEWQDGQRFGDGRRYSAAASGTEGSKHTFVALRISGEKRGGSPGAIGAVTARLIAAGRDIDLGGRRLDSAPGSAEEGASADFVPRGLPLSQAMTSDARKYRELEHYQALRVPYGEEIAIELAIRAERGEVGWRGRRIEIFVPTYEARSERLPCGEPLRQSEIAAGLCPLPAIFPAPAGVRRESASPSRTIVRDLGCDAAAPLALLASMGLAAEDHEIETSESTACPMTRESLPCPENYGVPDGSAPERICPLPSKLATSAGNVRWETIRKRLGAAFEWRPATCAESRFAPEALPAELLRYAKLIPGEPRLTGSRLVPGEESCPGFERKEEALPKLESEIADLACDWRDAIVKSPAYARYEGWSLDLSRRPISERRSPAKPAGCSRYREAFEASGRRLVASGVSAAEAIAICRERSGCEHEPREASRPGQSTLDLSAAAAFGWRELRAAYPRAQAGCSGAHCAEIEVTTDGAAAIGSARLEVPVLILFGKTATLTHRSRRRLEGGNGLPGER